MRVNGNAPFIQYGDPTLEKKLWGDDDTIIFGDATNNFSSAQKFYAGDGDDTVTMGDEYRKSYGFGGRGDDIINLPGSFIGNAASQIRVFGGYGDDMILAKSVDDTAGGPSARLYGDEGNDKIYGIHKLSNLSRLEGNDGDDKLISGEEIMVLSSIEGNGGNDIIYGADSGTQEIFIGD